MSVMVRNNDSGDDYCNEDECEIFFPGEWPKPRSDVEQTKEILDVKLTVYCVHTTTPNRLFWGSNRSFGQG